MLRVIRKYRLPIFLSLIILSLGALLRLSNPTMLPVFADESIYVRWSQVMRSEATLRFLPLSDGKQPLFMWATIPFLKTISDPLIAGRTLSALCGLATIAGIGILAYVLFGNLYLAITTSFIWSTLPYAVFFERLALADSMLVMFLVYAYVFALLALKHLRFDLAMLSGFALGFAWLTKSPAMFGYAFLPLGLVFINWKSLSGWRRLYAPALILTPWIIGFAMYSVLRLGPEFHMISLRNQDYVYPLLEVLKHPLDPLMPHMRDAIDFYLRLITPLGVLLGVLGLVADRQSSHWRQRLFLFTLWIVPIIAQGFIARTFTARYLLFTVPFSIILVSHAIWHLTGQSKKLILSLSLIAVLGVTNLGFDYLLLTSPSAAPLPRIERSGYLEEWTAGHGIFEASQLIREAAKSGPVLVGSEGFFGTPFSALQMYLNDLPGVRVIGVGQNISAISASLTNSLGDNQVFFVANSSRMLVSPDKLPLQVLGIYPKSARPDGTHDSLIVARVLSPTPAVPASR